MLAALLVMAPAAVRAAPLRIADTDHAATCDAAEWAEVAASLDTVAAGRAPVVLQALARTYVCGSGEAADRVVRRSAPRRVGQEVSGSGEPSVSARIDRSELRARGGVAWDTSVQDDGADVSLVFFVDEACVHSVRFRFGAGAWLIVAVGDACD